MLRPNFLLLLVTIVVSLTESAQHGNDYTQANIEKMAQLMERWNRMHPVVQKPLPDNVKAFLDKYSNKIDEHDHVLSIPEINGASSAGLIEGDIIPSTEDIAQLEERILKEEAENAGNRTKRAASRISKPTFPTNKPIPYFISSAYDDRERAMIHSAIGSIEDHTCIRFIENGTGLALEYSVPNAEETCQSEIGDHREENMRIDGTNQIIYLAKSCFYDHVVEHETFHALGFSHTMMRPDRDEYMQVLYDEMREDEKSQYRVMDTAHFDNHSVPYEYNSIMHYPADHSSKVYGTISIMPLDPEYVTSVGGIEHGPTFNDWKQVNIRYKCSEKCTEKIDCENKGYQNPNNCTECVCPIFYTGLYCENEVGLFNLESCSHTSYDCPYIFDQRGNDPERPEGISSQADGSHKNPDFPDYEKTRNVIRAPEGHKIRITINKIESVEPVSCVASCHKNAVEFVDGDLSLVGKRFCCSNMTGHSFVSKTNVIGFQVYAKPGVRFLSNVSFAIEPIEEVSTVAPTTSDSSESTTLSATSEPAKASEDTQIEQSTPLHRVKRSFIDQTPPLLDTEGSLTIESPLP